MRRGKLRHIRGDRRRRRHVEADDMVEEAETVFDVEGLVEEVREMEKVNELVKDALVAAEQEWVVECVCVPVWVYETVPVEVVVDVGVSDMVSEADWVPV